MLLWSEVRRAPRNFRYFPYANERTSIELAEIKTGDKIALAQRKIIKLVF